MQDITVAMLKFKEATRHLWNTYLVESESLSSPEFWLAVDTIERELFRTIVLTPRGAPEMADLYRVEALPQIIVRPESILTEVPIRFGELDVNGNWGFEKPRLIRRDQFPVCHFIQFFDWNPYGRIDLPYVKVMDARSRRPALLEQAYCQFAFAATEHLS